MSTPVKRRILVVDDDESVRELFRRILQKEGYDVDTAQNGFDALLKLKDVVIPDVIISDLNMPEMSGFELLSVVRRRFPKISVIASSGAYASKVVPSGVLADAFYAKGEDRAETLLSSVAALIQTSAAQASSHQNGSAPVWIPRNGKDSNGIPYRDYLHRMSAFLPAECKHRGEPGGTRNTMSVLLQYGQIHY